MDRLWESTSYGLLGRFKKVEKERREGAGATFLNNATFPVASQPATFERHFQYDQF